jgi:hypothetical protein
MFRCLPSRSNTEMRMMVHTQCIALTPGRKKSNSGAAFISHPDLAHFASSRSISKISGALAGMPQAGKPRAP